MAITYTFKVTQLEVAPSLDGKSDVVTRVRYNYTGVDEKGNEGTFAGATPMPAPSGSFVAFNSLTEANIVSWLDAVADKSHMQEKIQEQINAKKTPLFVEKPMPWAPAVAETSGSL